TVIVVVAAWACCAGTVISASVAARAVVRVANFRVGPRQPALIVLASLALGPCGLSLVLRHGAGGDHCWLAPPLQVNRTSWVPLAVLEPGSSRHLPETGFSSSPWVYVQTWFVPPLQVHHSISVLMAVDLPVISRQPPSIWMVPLDAIVQFCAP